MVKRLTIVGLLLAIVVSVPIPAANTAACADGELWLSGVAPIGLLQLVCAINETGEPVTFEFACDDEGVLLEQDPDAEEYGPAIQKLELPEETRQQLLLLLTLWSRE